MLPVDKVLPVCKVSGVSTFHSSTGAFLFPAPLVNQGLLCGWLDPDPRSSASFWPAGFGMVKNPDRGSYFRELRINFWIKNTSILCFGYGSGRMENFGSGDKHPGSGPEHWHKVNKFSCRKGQIRIRQNYSGSDLAKKFHILPNPDPRHWIMQDRIRKWKLCTVSCSDVTSQSDPNPATSLNSSFLFSSKKDLFSSKFIFLIFVYAKLIKDVLYVCVSFALLCR